MFGEEMPASPCASHSGFAGMAKFRNFAHNHIPATDSNAQPQERNNIPFQTIRRFELSERHESWHRRGVAWGMGFQQHGEMRWLV